MYGNPLCIIWEIAFKHEVLESGRVLYIHKLFLIKIYLKRWKALEKRNFFFFFWGGWDGKWSGIQANAQFTITYKPIKTQN